MKINFRQGLISYQQSGAQAVFLLPGTVANNVTLSVAPQPTLATIAHGSSDYLLKFDQTVLNAWQLSPGIDNWLFIDQNLISGALTFGVTTFEPITSSTEPIGAAGQLWFDLNAMVMKTFNGTKWIDTPRLVVAKVQGGNTNQIQSYSTGSSVGVSIPSSPGFLMLDSQLRPLRTSAGELLTSDTPVRIKTTVGTSGVLSEPVNGFVPVRANQPIPAMSLVYFSGEDAVSLASSDPSLVDLKTPIGVVEHALATNEVGTLTQQGEITYDQWNWDASSFGKPLYCGFAGQLTTTRPQGVQAFRVGYIKNAKTILFYIDSETQPQVVSSPGAIISGTPPINAVTSLNGSGEIVTTVSMEPASPTQDGYMTSVQADLIDTFDTRITTNTDDIAALEAGKANTVHTHVIADVTGLQTDLDTLEASIATKMPFVGGTTGNFPSINSNGSLLDSGYAYTSFAPLVHVHTIADVTNLQTALNGKANVMHTHVIADVTGLQTDLDSRAFVNHTHSVADVSGLQTFLDNKAPLIHTHEIIDVNGLQEQLDLRSMVGHTHTIAQVVNLQTSLNGKANTVHTHVIADTTGLQTELDGKAATVHTHVAADVTDFVEAVQDAINIVGGTGITAAYNDAGDELVISSTAAALTQLSMFQGSTALSSYPNAAGVETRLVFGAGLQAMMTGDDDEIVTIQTTPVTGFLPLTGGEMTGAISVGGTQGTAGQILSSQGPSQPMAWIDAPTGGGGGSGSLSFVARMFPVGQAFFGSSLFGDWLSPDIERASPDITVSHNPGAPNTTEYLFNTAGSYQVSVVATAQSSNGWSSDVTIYGTKLVLPGMSFANYFDRSQYSRTNTGLSPFDGDFGSANLQAWTDTFTLEVDAGQTMNVALYAATYNSPGNIDYACKVTITRLNTV